MGKLTWIARTAAALGGVAWLGLKVPPAPFPPPSDFGRDLGVVDLPEGLPEPAHKYFQSVALLPRVTSVFASGRGGFALGQGGLRIWAPMRWRAYVEPGRQFRWESELTWFGRPVVGGCDEIVAGVARSTQGWQTLAGEATHKAAHTALWLYTLAFAPSALFALPGVRWQPLDRTAARLIFPYRDDEWTFSLFFDPASGTLTRLTTHRFKPEIGAFRPYQVRFGERRSLGGTSLPSWLETAWVGVPSTRLTLEQVRYNVELPFPAEGG